MRSRCDRPAQVRLTYDTLRCRVFLDELPEATGMYQEICEYHAVRLKLPMGWELSDRRGATPALFDLEALVRVPASVRGGIVTRPGEPGTERIDLSDRRPPFSPEPERGRPPSTESISAPSSGQTMSPPVVPATAVGGGTVFSTSPVRGRRGGRSHGSDVGGRPEEGRRSRGFRDGRARSSRGRRPLPTPTELFGADVPPGMYAEQDDVDEGLMVVSVGDRSIETVIVLGPETAPPVGPDDESAGRE